MQTCLCIFKFIWHCIVRLQHLQACYTFRVCNPDAYTDRADADYLYLYYQKSALVVRSVDVFKHAQYSSLNSKQTCEHTIAQSYCTSGCFYILLSTDYRSAGSNEGLHTACACAFCAFVAYWPCHKKLEACGLRMSDDFYVTHTIADSRTRKV